VDISDKIEMAVEEFNRFRSPEATVFAGKKGENLIIAKFTGPFCVSCGVIDYFEDFIQFLEEQGINAVIDGVETSDRGFIVRFSVRE